ncbi:apoptotic chromatin condensation inducer in the nucleus [Coccinella septempunctata]|uniref:apoptotic chromatin condensation inducer in the nucleus n=1 Tax=Coccinella septempunctata TaxID=41139 RepID=UPI001D08C420|nr:apoptotic chromatin condensation inducer in the nucleus [Coccinella septempunctata]
MRRKSNRNSAKSTPEAKPETRKSTRSTRRRKSPSVESEECPASNVDDSINDNNTEKLKDLTSDISKESINVQNISAASADDEIKSDDEKGGHTPPHVQSTGNEAPKKDEVDADKGKSKGISNSQVEENSEIQMNSVTTGSPDEAIKNEVNPDVVNISVEGKVEIIEKQNVDSEIKSDIISNDKIADEKTESQDKKEESSEKSDVISCVETESDEKKSSSEIKDSENVKSESDKKETETEHSNNNIEVDDDQAEEGEIRESKSDEENEKYSKESPIKAKKTPMKIKLRRGSFLDSIERLSETDNKPAKRVKWDSESHRCLKLSFHDLPRLEIEDFKALSSDLKLAAESEVKLEEIYQPKVIKERVKSMDTSSEEVECPVHLRQLSTASSDDQESTNIIALNRKISIVDDSASKLKPPPSPAKQPVSQILFISNLVRPFTLKQLKELLERTGTIKEGGFWTDRIKSKCYVWYNSIEEAEATRNALHGVNWPVGNGKKLIIDYATEEQMEKEKNPPVQPIPPPVQITPPRAKTPQKENTEPTYDQRNGERREERKRKDSEREKERVKPVSTREWDLGKESNKERIRSRSRDRRRKHSGKRSPTPLEDFIARKQKKLEESVPLKLMDDLFQRTKAMPCIYWQPLSPEEISVKQQQRLSRMEEHKRRLEENSRNRGVGARDRGSYRRRYD